MQKIETLRWLTPQQVLDIRRQFGSPVYVYDECSLRSQVQSTLAFPQPFGLKVRYAIKANPNSVILKLLDDCGIQFDASSGFEAHRAMKAGIAPTKISLSAQQMPDDPTRMRDADSIVSSAAPHAHRHATVAMSVPFFVVDMP